MKLHISVSSRESYDFDGDAEGTVAHTIREKMRWWRQWKHSRGAQVEVHDRHIVMTIPTKDFRSAVQLGIQDLRKLASQLMNIFRADIMFAHMKLTKNVLQFTFRVE